jgi:regulator of protease activity HflC (stomatin/prohibitin superfamily)
MLYLFATVIVLLLITLILTFFTVDQQTAKIVQRYGRFIKVARSGLNVKAPWVDSIAGIVDLRIQQLNVKVDTKTEDNVFVRLTVAVQYQVVPERVEDAFYKLENHGSQMEAYVSNLIRAEVPKLGLDRVFAEQNHIADAVESELKTVMEGYGYRILKTLVTEINPDQSVVSAMNEINAAQRLRVAATEKGEAEKILKIKAAEADAESKALQGEGVARERKAILDGLRESVEDFAKAIEGATAQDAMRLVALTQYYDTLGAIGARSNSNTLMIPHGPGAVTALNEQIMEAMLAGNAVPVPKA